MIRYSLNCEEGHTFESWFASSEDFERLKDAGHLSCAVCNGPKVTKALMAPRVAQKDVPDPRPLSHPASPAEQALRALRAKVEATAEDVGRSFATEARAIHDGEAPERPIYGQAKADEARGLIEDGVPVIPLPWKASPKN